VLFFLIEEILFLSSIILYIRKQRAMRVVQEKI